MPSEAVECVTPDGITFYSNVFPNRCVREVFFGFAMYVKDGVNGIHKGITDKLGAFQWLTGINRSEIEHYTIAF